MQSANRVALNTIIQYVQLIVNVLVGLVSVRLILGALGECDYGIYSLVGGVIALVSFISSSIAQTSIRFISISLSKKNEEIKKTVSSCFSLHLYLAFTLVILLIALIPFLFNGFLNIPEDRQRTAVWVYLFMNLTLFLNILNTPFIAIIQAHEKFVISSSIAILSAIMKLCTAIFVSNATTDRLMIYGFLMMLITIVEVSIYQIIVNYNYREILSYRLERIKELNKITSFAGWTLFDTAGAMFTNQGYAVLYNKFFGPIMNTVYGLSQQLSAQVYSISSSVVTTFKPQIMKSYGEGDKERSLRLAYTAGKMGFFMMSIVAIPFIVMMPDVLNLWLKEGNYPVQTIFFARVLIIDILIEQLTIGLVYANQAIGKVKWFSIVVSTIRMSAIPASIILFFCGFPAEWGVIMCLLFETTSSLSRVLVMHRISGISVLSFFKDIYFRVFFPFVISFVLCYLLYHQFHTINWMLLTILINSAFFIVLYYVIALNILEKNTLLKVIKSFCDRIIN